MLLSSLNVISFTKSLIVNDKLKQDTTQFSCHRIMIILWEFANWFEKIEGGIADFGKKLEHTGMNAQSMVA